MLELLLGMAADQTVVLRMMMAMMMMMMMMMMATTQAAQTVVVRTEYGDVRGLRNPINSDMFVDTFFNIPYAKPPVGELRFRAPRPPQKWTGVRDGTRIGPQCPQHTFPDSMTPPDLRFLTIEDCLVLNVYSPKPVTNTSGLLPVMVWIHGGGYYLGTSNIYNGTQLAAKGVVVVTINYRLDALGFLSTEDEAAMGNYGILDQIRALEWVRDIISAFKGDPDNVTIFGESAGSSSVSLLLLARKARGLFHKAIMESGVSLSSWAASIAGSHVQPEAKQLAARLARAVNCTSDNTTAMVNCLRTKDANAIINVTWAMATEKNQILFRPAVNVGRHDALFDVTPGVAFTNDQFVHVPTIRGYNRNEWARLVNDTEGDGITMAEFREAVRTHVERWFIAQPVFNTDLNATVERFIDLYVNRPGIQDPHQLAQTLIQLATDVMFVAPTLKEIALTSERTTEPQYLYRFSYRPQNSRLPDWMGAMHGDEVPFVFGSPFTDDLNWPQLPSNWTDDDRRVSDDVMNMWANFAKYGNPTPSASDRARWLPWTQTARHYQDIGHPSRLLVSDPPPDCPVLMQCTGQLAGTLIG